MTIIATRQMLHDAQQAYHALQTGTQARVVVDQNGERVEFTAANRDALYAYIQKLQAQLNPATPAVVAQQYGPAGFMF